MTFLLLSVLLMLICLVSAGQFLKSQYYSIGTNFCYGKSLLSADQTSYYKCCDDSVYDSETEQSRFSNYLLAYSYPDMQLQSVSDIGGYLCTDIKQQGNFVFSKTTNGVQQHNMTQLNNVTFVNSYVYANTIDFALTNSSIVIVTGTGSSQYTHDIYSGSLLFEYTQPEFLTSGYSSVAYDSISDTLFYAGIGVTQLYYISNYVEQYQNQTLGDQTAQFDFALSSYSSGGDGMRYCKMSSLTLFCYDSYYETIVNLNIFGAFLYYFNPYSNAEYLQTGVSSLLVPYFEVGHDTGAIYIPAEYDVNGLVSYGLNVYQLAFVDGFPIYIETIPWSSSLYNSPIIYLSNGLLMADIIGIKLEYYSVINSTVASIVPARVSALVPLNISLQFSSPVIPVSWVPVISIGSQICSNVTVIDSQSIICQPPVQVGAQLELYLDYTQYYNPITISKLVDYKLPSIVTTNNPTSSTRGGSVLNLVVDNLGLPGLDIVYVYIGEVLCLNATQLSLREVTCKIPKIPKPFNQLIQVEAGGQFSNDSIYLEVIPPAVFTTGSLAGFSTNGGDTLSLIGSGFGWCNGTVECSSVPVQVGIGDLQCVTPHVVNDSLISCITPPGVGEFLQVSLRLGQQLMDLSLSVTLSYNAPIITQITPSTISANNGGQFTLLGSSFGSAAEVTLQNAQDASLLYVIGVSNILSSNDGQISIQLSLIQQQSAVSQIPPGEYVVIIQAGNQAASSSILLTLVKEPYVAIQFLFQLISGQVQPSFSLGPSEDQFGSQLTYEIFQLPVYGSVYGAGNVLIGKPLSKLQTSNVQFVPDKYFAGVDQFAYRIIDIGSNLTSEVAFVLFNYTFVNQAPFVYSQQAKTIVPMDMTSTILLDFTDKDDLVWRITILSLPTQGKLVDRTLNTSITDVPYLLAGNYTSDTYLLYTPKFNEFGDAYDTFQWSVQDPYGLYLNNLVTQTINVEFSNHPPLITTVRASGLQYQDILLTLSADDLDSAFQTLIFTVVSLPQYGILYQVDEQGNKTVIAVASYQDVINSQGKLVWSPLSGTVFNGTDEFIYSVSDGFIRFVETAYIDIIYVYRSMPVFTVLGTTSSHAAPTQTQEQVLNVVTLQSAQETIIQTSVMAIFGIAIGVLFTGCLILRRWRKTVKQIRSEIATEVLSMYSRDSARQGSVGALYKTVVDGSVVSGSYLGTIVASNHELSVPLFAEKMFGTDFRQTSLVAQGGIGAVYRCQIINRQKFVNIGSTELAVKNFGKNVEELSNMNRIAFYQEISLMWLFRDQPQFARLYGFSSQPATIVLKFYGLGSLDQFIQMQSHLSSSFTTRQSLHILIMLCQGLTYMHSKQFVHCDVKPANILLEMNYEIGLMEPRISDFGITRLVDKCQSQVAAFELSDIRGASISFAAPEVLHRYRSKQTPDDPVEWKAGDVYAVAVTMSEMLTRQHGWPLLD